MEMKLASGPKVELFLDERVDGTYAVLSLNGEEHFLLPGELQTLAETFMHYHNTLLSIRMKNNPKLGKAVPQLAISGLGVDDDDTN